jgi:hypothetical protein
MDYYNYFVFVFAVVFLLNVFEKKTWSGVSLSWLFAVLVVYIGIAFIGYLFPLYDLDNSTKRGLFKIFPLMLLFMGNSPLLLSLSEKIRKWESAQSDHRL